MTHIKNIPHILQYGITHANSIHANPDFVPIGDKSLISKRSHSKLNNGRYLGEYIPFYFGTRMPMLFVIQNGFNMIAPTPAEDIIYCVSSVQKIIDLQLEFVFTDGHAVGDFSTQFTTNDIYNINNIIDKKAINAKYWIDYNDLDKKRRKEAEFLVLGDIALDGILGYVTYNQTARQQLINYGINADKVIDKPTYYF